MSGGWSFEGGSRSPWFGVASPDVPARGSAADVSLVAAEGAGERAAAPWFEEERDAELGEGEGEVSDDHAGEGGEARKR